MLALFHAAVLALPVVAFLWTFFGFSAFSLVTGVPVRAREKVSFALLNLCAVALALLFFINESGRPDPTLRVVGIVGAALAGILYVFAVVSFVRKYWPPVREEMLRWLGKSS